ncbi:hypothetical protein LJC58_08200 [Lachnospiraceae bacterium OttesenSCG-928-D06]|nr:hypothetical protein [Lachnospiraceae bacterium OttesenSCG-928-D06]
MADISKSWFCVLNNPEERGYTGEPHEVVEKLKTEWIENHPTRTGAWVYCISKKGLPHVHMVLEDSIAMRFSKIKKSYAVGMHFEATKGQKNQVEAYITKQPPFDEKGEEIICTVLHGELKGVDSYFLNRKDPLETIERLLDEGKTPNEIMSMSIYFRKQEALIRKEFFARRFALTPPKRDVEVFWHIGESGSGKSFEYVKLCEELGDENIYLMNDYQNNGSGGLDTYCAEPVLFMDEYKGGLRYQTLLNMLDGYRFQIHCRYANAYALWTTVHITSIFPPESAYKFMVEVDNQQDDTVKQLLRRITHVVYHWKEGFEYKSFTLSGKEYKNYEQLKEKANGGFMQLSMEDLADIPFD